MEPPLDSLADSDAFEALTYDLLAAEGFEDLVWRGPAADGGRDIEASWQTIDPTGHALRTRWYVECKWYTGSVPYAELEPKLLAAASAGVDYLLVVTSSRVMNTTMDSVQRWLDTRSHPFRVRYWTGHDVVTRVASHKDVFVRHFPAASHPLWATQSAETSRLRGLIANSSQRLVWRVVPVLQWASQQTTFRSNPNAAPAVQELELLLASTRLHQLLFEAGAVGSPALRPVELQNLLRETVDTVKRRRKSLTIERDVACETLSSGPVLRGLLFELLLNAAQYADDASTCVSLDVTGTQWLIAVRNKSSHILLNTWPIVGYRGDDAEQRNAGGQGLGASLARAGADDLKLSLSWRTEAGSWIVEVGGKVA